MTLVLHNIGGRLYWYDHYRVPNRKNPTTAYVGVEGGKAIEQQQYIAPKEKLKVVDTIKEKPGFPNTEAKYEEAHKETDIQERSEYGKDQFDKLENLMDKRLKEGELAGHIDKDANIKVSNKIPEEYHGEVARHEVIEYEKLTGKGIERPEGAKGKKTREDMVKAALKHPDKLGAGAKRRRELNLTPAEHREAVMREFERGTLHTSSGKLVTDRKQALAIAYSETGETKKE